MRHRPVNLTKEAAREAVTLPPVDPIFMADIPISEYEIIIEKKLRRRMQNTFAFLGAIG